MKTMVEKYNIEQVMETAVFTEALHLGQIKTSNPIQQTLTSISKLMN